MIGSGINWPIYIIVNIYSYGSLALCVVAAFKVLKGGHNISFMKNEFFLYAAVLQIPFVAWRLIASQGLGDYVSLEARMIRDAFLHSLYAVVLYASYKKLARSGD